MSEKSGLQGVCTILAVVMHCNSHVSSFLYSTNYINAFIPLKDFVQFHPKTSKKPCINHGLFALVERSSISAISRVSKMLVAIHINKH